MAKFSPFAEKAGMGKVAEQHSVEGVKKLAQTIANIGFDLQLIGSQRYVESKLESLTEEQINEVRTAFLANKHPRFKKEVAPSRHEPYGKTSDYITYIQNADNPKLARLIKILAMLSQTKAYLIWKDKYKEKLSDLTNPSS